MGSAPKAFGAGEACPERSRRGALAETILLLTATIAEEEKGSSADCANRTFIKKFPLELSVQSVTSVVLPILRVYWSAFVVSSFLSGICGTKFSKIFKRVDPQIHTDS